MDKGARNWLFKYAHKNLWRVAAWMDFDDLVQEGYAAYYETLQRYPTATEPKHIMSLFALVFRSRIERLVLANRKQVDDACSDVIESYDGDTQQVPITASDRKRLPKPSKFIKEILSLLRKNKALRYEITKPYTILENGRRETTNERFCRLLGEDPNSINVADQLREYFS